MALLPGRNSSSSQVVVAAIVVICVVAFFDQSCSRGLQVIFVGGGDSFVFFFDSYLKGKTKTFFLGSYI